MQSAINLIPRFVCVLALLGCLDTLTAQSNTFQSSPSQLTFNIPQAGVLPAQNSAQLSISTSVAGSSAQFATSAPAWLSLTPATGIASSSGTAVTVSLTSAALGLQEATYSGVIMVTQIGGAAVQSLPIPVVLNVGNQLVLTPSNALNLTHQLGQAAPFVTLNVASTISSLPFSVTGIQPSGSWLLPSAAPNAVTPGSVSVSVNPNGLTPGYYTGTFRIASQVTGVSPQDVTVNLTVSQNPTLSASPQQLSYSYQTGTTTGALPGKIITLTTSGGQVGFSVDPSPQSWLSVVANGSVASQAQPATLTVTVNPNSPVALPPGTYNANITVRPVTGAGSPLIIPVSLLVSSKALLSIGNPPSPFNYQVGGAFPADQTVSISSSSTQLDFTISQKPAWLDVFPGTASTFLAPVLTLHVIPAVVASMGTGSFTGTVTVSAPEAGNPTMSFPVTLNITFVPALTSSVAGLTFNYQTTIPQQPAAQFFTVNSSGAPIAIGAPVVTTSSCGTNWLSATVSSPTTPATVFVSVVPTGINQPATCTGTVTIPSQAAASLAIPISLNVSANALLTVSAPDLNFTAPLGTVSTQQRNVNLSSTDLASPVNFTVTSDAAWLTPSIPSGRTDTSPSFIVYVNPGVFVQPGTYTGNLTVLNQSANPAGSQPGQVLRVVLTINSNTVLTVSPQVVNLAVSPGGAAVTQPVQVNLSSGTAGITAFVTTNQGGNWLKVSFGSGTPGTTASGTAPTVLNVTADPTSLGLAPGDYTGSVTVSGLGLQNSPQIVSVKLTVGATQSFALSVPSLALATNTGATTPVTGTFSLSTTGGSIAFTIAKGATRCDAISVDPASGTAGAVALPITVTLNPTGLAAGQFSCALTVSGPPGSGILAQTLTVNVTVQAVPQPLLLVVRNGASYSVGAIAPGEVIYMEGSNLGPTTLTGYVMNPDNTFATTVAGTTVKFDSIPAPILYTQNSKVSVVVPFEIAGRITTNVTVERFGQVSAALQMQVVPAALGLFTTNAQGVGQGAILNQDGITVNGPSAPAPKGSVVSIYLTGAGLMSYANQSGILLPALPLPTLLAPVTVSIGSQSAQIQYSGGAPGSIAGLYQINAVVPDKALSGGQLVTVTVWGLPAQGNVLMFVQ